MKRNIFWLGMLVMILTFGMTVVSCDDGGDDNNNNNNNGNGNGNGNGVTVPADLQGVWKYTFTSGTRTLTFSGNTYVYEQLLPTLTSGGVQYTNVKLKLTYTVTANTPVTNTDTATDTTEFPSGYNLTQKLTNIENSHPAIQNSPNAAVGQTDTSPFYINAAKNKIFGGYGQMSTYTKQ
jgi:hypothetical protein